MANKPHPLPEWFSETAQREARKADSPDELFGAAYSEGIRDAQKQQRAPVKKTRHSTTKHGMSGAQFTMKSFVRGMKRGIRAAGR